MFGEMTEILVPGDKDDIMVDAGLGDQRVADIRCQSATFKLGARFSGLAPMPAFRSSIAKPSSYEAIAAAFGSESGSVMTGGGSTSELPRMASAIFSIFAPSSPARRADNELAYAAITRRRPSFLVRRSKISLCPASPEALSRRERTRAAASLTDSFDNAFASE
jgi:hypothetical protein